MIINKSLPLNEINSRLILHLAPNFGPKAWSNCLRVFSSAEITCQQNSASLQDHGLSQATIEAIQNPDWQTIDAILTWAQEPNHTLLFQDDPRYPKLLAETATPPFLLYIDGDVKHLLEPQIAIVGTRHPTHMGLSLARFFAHELCLAGFVIISGMAIGIDAASHQAAIDTKKPTLAVLGTGVNCNYPERNRKIAEKIRENGAIISEFSLNTPPQAKNFPQRNRIISGLSLGTLVIEAALKSGSLITARLAAEQGREVFATPSSITNPVAAGCHYLIQQGAKLTTQVSDILEEFPIIAAQITQRPIHLNLTMLDKDHQKLIECIGFDIIKIEQLIDRTQFSLQKVSSMLCNLLLNGYIKEEMGGYSRAIL